MTQTNQNKDYSWLDPIFLQYHAELNQGLNELAGHGTALEQAKAAIQQHIDEHYIGKGEAKNAYLRGRIDEAKTCEKAHRLFTKQQVEQRCIEAVIKELRSAERGFKAGLVNADEATKHAMQPIVDVVKNRADKLEKQLSTNNKDCTCPKPLPEKTKPYMSQHRSDCPAWKRENGNKDTLGKE